MHSACMGQQLALLWKRERETGETDLLGCESDEAEVLAPVERPVLGEVLQSPGKWASKRLKVACTHASRPGQQQERAGGAEWRARDVLTTSRTVPHWLKWLRTIVSDTAVGMPPT
jgi:hypothetical protein